MMKCLFVRLSVFLLMITFVILSQYGFSQDTIVVQTFSFDDPSPEGWGAPYKGKFIFPEKGENWEKILMVRTLKCDEKTAADKFPCGEWDYHTHTIVYVPKDDTTEIFQIGSFITPYGKRLKLGDENGWSWVYDVTDYGPLLTGEKEIWSGNNQELLDMKFYFIKGKPARNIISVENIYPYGNYKYKDLANDSILKAKNILLNPDAQGFMLRARISGHGHFGPRNCCEWDSKNHTYFINEWDHFRWNVWKDCGYNPIYPQGGTWPFDRAGWCPGTKVDEYDFELTPLVKAGDTLKIDYAIEHYNYNGEKGGDYRMSHQLFTYGPPNFTYDVKIEEIITPSNENQYKRLNPICSNPRIIIRNNGKQTLKTLKIIYGLKNGRKSEYIWNGKLEFLQTVDVWLPTPDWKGLDKLNHFEVVCEKPNGVDDEYLNNNKLESEMPKKIILPSQFILKIKTNNLGRADDNSYTIANSNGEIIYSREKFEDDSLYNDTIALNKGCYEFRFKDKKEDGLIKHWWNYGDDPEKVGKNGSIEIISLEGIKLYEFKYDFGQETGVNFWIGDLP